MDITKQEYLQNVLDSYRMRHIESLVGKHRNKRDEIKENLDGHFGGNIYSPMNSGSFAKHTAINSKFDLDLVVPFKRNSFDTLEGMFDDTFQFLQDEYQGVATIRKQKVSIGIEFFTDSDGDKICIDVVPGRELNQDQYNDDNKLNLYVNDQYGTLSEKSYLLTNIRAQIDHIKAKENERKIIRLLKIWKTNHSEPYKSFLLELFAIKAFTAQEITGNLWEKLSVVSEYISENVVQDNFSLIDPGNSNNNVLNTLTDSDKQALSSKMKQIKQNIESDESWIKYYFPENSEYKESESGGYGFSAGSKNQSIPPRNQRFG